MKLRNDASSRLAHTAVLVLVACIASCRPEEPKRLPPARAGGNADAPAAGSSTPSENPAVTVKHSDGSPFPGCKVSAFEPSAHTRVAGGTSDASGVAHLDGIDVKRRYELVVEPPADQLDAFDTGRTHAWTPSDTAVTLAALLTVEGRVTAADGGPAKGGAVRCSHANGAVSVNVGADGRFVVRRVPEGAVELAVAASWADAEQGRCGPATHARAGDRDVVLTAQ